MSDRERATTVPSSAGTAGAGKGRRRWPVAAVWVLAPLLFVTVVATTVEKTHGPALTRPSNAIATGQTADGRRVAVVAYETDTFPSLDLFRIRSIGYSVQATAFDLDTGERLWDTMLSNDHPSVGAQALAVGGDHAYVRTDDGLVILDAATGDIVARDDRIRGLGEDRVASLTSYGYDPGMRLVVLKDGDGTVLGIPLGSDTAGPVPPDVARRWEEDLAATEPDPFLYSETMDDTTNHEARLPGPEPEPDPLTGIVPKTDMLRASWAPEDAWSANVVLDPATGYAAGSEFGFAVSEAYDGGGYTYQVADLTTGEARAGLEVRSGAGITTVTVDPAGYVVMTVPNEEGQGLLVVATADSIRTSVIGERGWLGT
ncbi:PA2928 family protein [Nocardiopsis sp. NPDC006139]|uniref:PA2928 family protein n=1 Tax=Nocardiopsis sp. NPDC006139 TaxID=3154578 RepID=UPI0033BF37B5